MKKLDYIIKEYRYHTHEDDRLNGMIVDFLVTNKEYNRTQSFSTLLHHSLIEDKTDDEIIVMAYNQLKYEITAWDNESPKTQIIGSKFIPPEDKNNDKK